MRTIWEIEEPTGLVNKKTLPYVSNFWKATSETEAYFIGLTADIGMEPSEIYAVIKQVLNHFEHNGIGNFAVHSRSAYNLPADLDELLTHLSSPWYSDSVWLLSEKISNTTVLLEPQSDGTEIGIFFYGPKALAAYTLFLNWAKELAH